MSSRPVHRSSHSAVYPSPLNERLRDVLTAGLLQAKPAAVQSPFMLLSTVAPRPPSARARDKPSWGSVGALVLGLTIGGDANTGKQPRRSQRLAGPSEPPQPPILERVETDREGRVVYVDLEPRGEDRMLQALRDHLSAAQPTPRMLERLPLINRNRALVEIEDRVALDLFQAWLLGSAFKGPMGEALGNLFSPLEKRILLLGAHFICPRVTALEPRILPQTPHTDVDTKGEVIAVGLHVLGDDMNTLLDPHATLRASGEVQNGSGFRRAHTPTFAFETAAVHAGPGISHIPGPYPRFLTSRVFFLLCAADLDPSKIAKHRADNGLAGGANLAFAIP